MFSIEINEVTETEGLYQYSVTCSYDEKSAVLDVVAKHPSLDELSVGDLIVEDCKSGSRSYLEVCSDFELDPQDDGNFEDYQECKFIAKKMRSLVGRQNFEQLIS